jgi:hypothetical protein
MRRDSTTAGGGASGIVELAGQTSNLARCAISSNGLLWRQGIAWCAIQGINEWCAIDTSA